MISTNPEGTTLNINSRLLILENRFLEIEKTQQKILDCLNRLKTSMNYLDGNDDTFLEITKKLNDMIQINEKVDEVIHEKLANRLSGLKLQIGKHAKRIKKLDRRTKTG